MTQTQVKYTACIHFKLYIWDTEYTVSDFGDYMIIGVPCTHTNKNGTITFFAGHQKITINTPKKMLAMRKMLDEQTLVLYDQDEGKVLEIDEVLYVDSSQFERYDLSGFGIPNRKDGEALVQVNSAILAKLVEEFGGASC